MAGKSDRVDAGLEHAGFGRRLVALLIDALSCAAVAALFTYPHPPRLVSALVFLIVYTFFTGLFGQTLGMRLCGLYCVDSDTGHPIGVLRALPRTVLLQLVVPAVVRDADGRGLHDRVAHSTVFGPAR